MNVQILNSLNARAVVKASTIHLSIHQSINQSIDQLINQPIYLAVYQWDFY